MSAPKRWSARMPVTIGLIATVTLVGGFGSWAVFTSIAGAVIASGQLEVKSQRQIIQHPDGGVVGALPVADGDFVAAGDIVLQLDDTLLRSEESILDAQYYELMARSARLKAESEVAPDITFSAELRLRASQSEEVAELVEGQSRLFEARRETRARQISQLSERQTQIAEQIAGRAAQLEANFAQQEIVRRELADLQSLLQRGLTQVSRVLSLQREEARLQGENGSLRAAIAESRVRIAEIETEKLGLADRVREEAIAELRDLTFRESELRERRLALSERLSRLDIRAPMSGYVLDRQVHALRAVVRPADPILSIIPEDSPLVIISRVDPIHIDQVSVGQPSGLRFSALDARQTPELSGTVVRVSADIITDVQSGLQYYEAEITPLPGEIEKLEGQVLVPGMPVEAFIQTGSRSPLSYLVRPFADYFNRAFRET